MFKFLYADIEGKNPNDKKRTSLEKGEYVRKAFADKGWDLLFFKADPTSCEWNTPIKVFDGLFNKGHEIVLTGIDYVPLLSTKGLPGQGGTEIRYLIRKYKNYGAKRDMAILTPLQASPAALSLDSEGYTSVEKCNVMARRGLTAGSRQIVQEVDGLTFIDKVIYEGQPVLNVVIAKHKNPNVIPEAHKKFFLRFELGKPIVGDLNKEKAYWEKVEDVPVINTSNEEETEEMY
jgi:hypothetical protein